jgi:hypothetical protein
MDEHKIPAIPDTPDMPDTLDVKAQLDVLEARFDVFAERLDGRLAPLEKLAAWAEEMRRENMSAVERDEEDMRAAAVEAGFTPQQVHVIDRLNRDGNESIKGIGREIDDVLRRVRRHEENAHGAWHTILPAITPLVKGMLDSATDYVRDQQRPWWQKQIRKIVGL